MKSCRNIHHQENHPSINPAPQLLNQYSSLVISEECMATALPCLSCPDPHLLEKPQESESGVWKRMSLNPASLFFSKWRPFEGAQHLHLTLRLSFSFLFFCGDSLSPAPHTALPLRSLLSGGKKNDLIWWSSAFAIRPELPRAFPHGRNVSCLIFEKEEGLF